MLLKSDSVGGFEEGAGRLEMEKNATVLFFLA